eukprot:TRINITY_DN891_c0_g1_i2.p1 TRINITY_DN891_c0_g1~~TRINITY_DN891_c0_g1_i2.p1  ORF type:complete len:360 (+),score=48.47 TRINITY_DN891_c0_g1_i2:400-1479(+)
MDTIIHTIMDTLIHMITGTPIHMIMDIPIHTTTEKYSMTKHSHDSPETDTIDKPTFWEGAFYAIGATVVISTVPLVILPFIPITGDSSPLLKILVSFAAGGLLGDVFLHLIPHALEPHSHSHEDDAHAHTEEGHSHTEHLVVGLSVLGGILFFFIFEKIARSLHGGHSHSHSHSQPTQVIKETDTELRQRKNNGKEVKAEKPKKKKAKKGDIKISAYLNLFADATHNFTDGLAIGASFLQSTPLGLSTTLAVLFHEIPHEIGDYAILIQSGFPKSKAIGAQVLTAVGAIMGTCVGIMIEGVGTAAASWVLPFTAGGFIYIATVNVIPELLTGTGVGQTIKEALAFSIGVGFMVIVAIYE